MEGGIGPISAAGLQDQEPLKESAKWKCYFGIMIDSYDRGMSGLARKEVPADVPGFCEVRSWEILTLRSYNLLNLLLRI